MTSHRRIGGRPRSCGPLRALLLISLLIAAPNVTGTGPATAGLTQFNAAARTPRWSPDGTKIVFASFRGATSFDIYVVDPSVRGDTQLTGHQWSFTSGGGFEWGPSWSPDGTKITFSVNRQGFLHIYTMNADGTDQMRLTADPRANAQHREYRATFPLETFTSWSPDGRKIAFVSHHDGNHEIHTIDADGTNETNLTRNNASDVQPSWAPDGRTIAFASDRHGDHQIYLMDADGSRPRRVTDGLPWDWRYGVGWSPDGTKLAYTSTLSRPRAAADWRTNPLRRDVSIMDADGGARANLTLDEGDSWAPAWSPDGERIAFVSRRDAHLVWDKRFVGAFYRFTSDDAVHVMRTSGVRPATWGAIKARGMTE